MTLFSLGAVSRETKNGWRLGGGGGRGKVASFEGALSEGSSKATMFLVVVCFFEEGLGEWSDFERRPSPWCIALGTWASQAIWRSALRNGTCTARCSRTLGTPPHYVCVRVCLFEFEA